MDATIERHPDDLLQPVDPIVDASLDWSFLAFEDLGELVELRLAIDYFQRPISKLTYEVFLGRWTDPMQDPARNAVVGRDKAGSIVAYAWNRIDIRNPSEVKVWIDGGTHPALRHLDLDKKRLAWQIWRVWDWLHEPGRETVRTVDCCQYLNPTNEVGFAAFSYAGMKPYRVLLDMSVDLTHYRKTEFEPPAPIQLVPWNQNLSEATRLAHNAAFATRKGTIPLTEKGWQQACSRPESRPEWSWLAMDGDRVVGYAVNSLTSGSGTSSIGGWIDMLGVIPEYRDKGVALALLSSSIRSFISGGCGWAGIGVDTENPDLVKESYAKLGLRVDDELILMLRELAKDMDPPNELLE